jgi:4-coumarate--CoA ligase
LSKSKYILTHPASIDTTLEAAKIVGIPQSKIFIICQKKGNGLLPFVTLPDLVKLGSTTPDIIPLQLQPHESKTKVALLNFSSGTSGLPKGVLITHNNVIANICQLYNMENNVNVEGQVANGCLPFFHSIFLFESR